MTKLLTILKKFIKYINIVINKTKKLVINKINY